MSFVKTREKSISLRKILKLSNKKICKSWWETNKRKLFWDFCWIHIKSRIMINCHSIKLILKANHSSKRQLTQMKLLIFIMICLFLVQVFKWETLMDRRPNQIKFQTPTDVSSMILLIKSWLVGMLQVGARQALKESLIRLFLDVNKLSITSEFI